MKLVDKIILHGRSFLQSPSTIVKFCKAVIAVLCFGMKDIEAVEITGHNGTYERRIDDRKSVRCMTLQCQFKDLGTASRRLYFPAKGVAYYYYNCPVCCLSAVRQANTSLRTLRKSQACFFLF